MIRRFAVVAVDSPADVADEAVVVVLYLLLADRILGVEAVGTRQQQGNWIDNLLHLVGQEDLATGRRIDAVAEAVAEVELRLEVDIDRTPEQ